MTLSGTLVNRTELARNPLQRAGIKGLVVTQNQKDPNRKRRASQRKNSKKWLELVLNESGL